MWIAVPGGRALASTTHLQILEAAGIAESHEVPVHGETLIHITYRSIFRRHVNPQSLLATYLNGKPLTAEHSAPVRLLAPMKRCLKNIKAITRIDYSKDEPADYWAKRGYSRYDEI